MSLPVRATPCPNAAFHASSGDVGQTDRTCFRVQKFTLKQEDTAPIRIPFAAKSRYLHEVFLIGQVSMEPGNGAG
jgi:hypothetical protein